MHVGVLCMVVYITGFLCVLWLWFLAVLVVCFCSGLCLKLFIYFDPVRFLLIAFNNGDSVRPLSQCMMSTL